MRVIPETGQKAKTSIAKQRSYYIPLINSRSRHFSLGQLLIKRLMDGVIAMVFGVLSIPLLAVIAIIIKLDSKGPVFYRQERVGKDGKIFKIFKFRSMVEDAEKGSGPVWAGKNDNRTTCFGQFLRKTHLDEIPQLINVLTGDMSLVGPRPERPFFVEEFIARIPNYSKRLQVRPGITGLSQVNYKYDTKLEDVKRKLGFDLHYINNSTMFQDLKILLNTAAGLLMSAFPEASPKPEIITGSDTGA